MCIASIALSKALLTIVTFDGSESSESESSNNSCLFKIEVEASRIRSSTAAILATGEFTMWLPPGIVKCFRVSSIRVLTFRLGQKHKEKEEIGTTHNANTKTFAFTQMSAVVTQLSTLKFT
uniref:Secreted protein n=1 Tax=Megaselia scalaris TaxID=36166 RepID=T1GB76_MEGSC